MEYSLPPYRNELPNYQTDPPRTELPPANPLINVALFFATVLTTLFAGAYLNQGDPLSRIERPALRHAATCRQRQDQGSGDHRRRTTG